MEKRRKASILTALALAAAMLAGAACSAPASDADDKTVQSLVIAQQPDRTRYIEGESFDPDGTVIDANLKDGFRSGKCALSGGMQRPPDCEGLPGCIFLRGQVCGAEPGDRPPGQQRRVCSGQYPVAGKQPAGK